VGVAIRVVLVVGLNVLVAIHGHSSFSFASDRVRAEIREGALVVTGTTERDKIRLALHPVLRDRLTITLDDDRLWTFEFDRSEFERIVVHGEDGSDLLRVDDRWGRFTDDEVTRLFGDDGGDDLDGGSGPEYLFGGPNGDVVDGRGGNDVLSGGTSRDNVFGGAGNDVLFGGDGGDLVLGDEGDDDLHGGDGRDGLMGYVGDDAIYAGRGDDRLVDGGSGDDVIFGGAGHDFISAKGGDDVVAGGPDHDRLYGHRGKDLLRGGPGMDNFYANDRMSDRIYGGADKDVAKLDRDKDSVSSIERVL